MNWITTKALIVCNIPDDTEKPPHGMIYLYRLSEVNLNNIDNKIKSKLELYVGLYGQQPDTGAALIN